VPPPNLQVAEKQTFLAFALGGDMHLSLSLSIYGFVSPPQSFSFLQHLLLSFHPLLLFILPRKPKPPSPPHPKSKNTQTQGFLEFC